MAEHMITHDQWNNFFFELSDEYHGMLVTVESVAAGGGTRLVALDSTFSNASVQIQRGAPVISIDVGQPQPIVVRAPFKVRTEPFAEGHGQIVEIESVAGPMIRLYLSYHPEQSTDRGEIFGSQGHVPFARQLGTGDFAASRQSFTDQDSDSQNS